MIARRRTAPRRPITGRQERGDRTSDLRIDETVGAFARKAFQRRAHGTSSNEPGSAGVSSSIISETATVCWLR